MEWLKAILGEEQYNKLGNEAIATLTKALGTTEYVANDPTKIIPKNVFNEKLEEIKLLKSQVENYVKELKNTSGLITDKEMKEKLAIQEAEFRNTIKEKETEFNTEIENRRKENLIQNDLVKKGCQHPDLLLKMIKFEDVIIKDDKVLNSDQIILPLRESYKTLFDVKLTGNPPPKTGAGGNPPPQSSKEDLIKQYDEAEKTSNYAGMARLQREIANLKVVE